MKTKTFFFRINTDGDNPTKDMDKTIDKWSADNPGFKKEDLTQSQSASGMSHIHVIVTILYTES